MKKLVTLSAIAFLSTATFASSTVDANIQAQLDALTKKVAQLEKKQKHNTKKISAVN